MNEVTRGKLAEDFKNVIGAVEQLVKATAGDAGERMGDLRQRLVSKIEAGKNALAERKNTWFRQSVESEPGVETNTFDRGVVAVAMAIGIGVLIGLLLRRK